VAFEVEYFYHERLEEGGYNKDETKSLKRKVGEGFEDVPLEKVAQHILAQLARRDIWVVDVKVYEFKKSVVNYRETKGGIVIKNKKFLLDNEGGNMIAHDVIDEPAHMPMERGLVVDGNGDLQIRHTPSGNMQPHEHPHQANQPRRVLRFVEFQPDAHLDEAKKKGLKFTVGRKYPLFKEMADPKGLLGSMYYTVLDDNKREVTTSDKYFVPVMRLDGDNEVDGGWESGPGGKNDIPLSYGQGVQKDELIDIRAAAGRRSVR